MNSPAKAENPKSRTECRLTCDMEILRQSPIFAAAEAEVVKLFAYLAQRKTYKAGQEIITVGREAGEAYYLISGTARVSTQHKGKTYTLQPLDQGTFFGELALLARFKWFFTVHAEEECEVMVISRESFNKVLDNFPQRRERLIEKIVQLRVERLIDQTTFMLDKVPDTLLVEGKPTI